MKNKYSKTGKWIAAVLVLSVLISVVNAQDDRNFLRGMYSSSAVVLENTRSGGSGDFGFTIVKKDHWDIRNTIGLHGYGSGEYGFIGISEKISFGGWFPKSETAFRPYGSISFLTCAFGGSGKSLFSLPLSMDITGSGGFEIMYTSSQGFYIEYGGGYRFTAPFEGGEGVTFMSAGIRMYFK